MHLSPFRSLYLTHGAILTLGGSTIVLLFEKGALEWDEDILSNSGSCLETLVRVGSGVGKATRPIPEDAPKFNSTGYISYPP